MLKVFKYEVGLYTTVVSLPVGAKVLHFDFQHDKPHIWVLVDPDALTELREFLFTGTGHEINLPMSQLRFIGTTLRNEPFVWHLFEILPEVTK